MKTAVYVLVGFISIFCLMAIGSSNVEASDYLGEFCWEIAEDGIPSGIVKVGVSDMGGGHYLLSGKITSYDGEINTVHGNAEIDKNNILLTLNSSGKDSIAMWTSTSHVILDISTLNGTYESIGHDRNYLDLSIDTEYDTGTLTFISCP